MSSLDDDRTVTKGMPQGLGRGPLDEPANALPAGTHLGEFEIQSVIGEGGFGIVYLAHDQSLGRQVAIKEYMPTALAARTHALTVSVRSDRDAETFAAGLRSFINEARLLAQFDHPSLLKVYRFWEANGTAYMVMPYYAGITLSRTLKQLPGSPDEAWLKDLLRHLLDALEQMHQAHCYHRDISPDNILIQPDGRPLLLDFGAARRVIGDMTRALTVILKTGYAPVEQYGEMPDLAQGAWTDLYALGSVVHFAITGNTPPPAIQRFLNDKFEPLVRVAAGRYSGEFLGAIDRALAVLPKDRPQGVAELRALLGVSDRRQGARGPAPTSAGAMSPPAPPIAPVRSSVQAAPAGSDGSALPRTLARADRHPSAWVTPLSPEERRRRYGLAAVVGAAVVIGIASVGYTLLLLNRGAPPADGAAQRATDATQVPTAPEPTLPPLPAALPEPPVTAQTTPASQDQPAALPSTSAAAATAPPERDRPVSQLPEIAPTPRVATRLPQSVSPDRPLPKNKLSARRCADIIQHVSLGEPLSSEDRDFLKQECGQ